MNPESVVAAIEGCETGGLNAMLAWSRFDDRPLPSEVARYAGGETKLLGFLIGEVMGASGGRADPAHVRTMLRSRLED